MDAVSIGGSLRRIGSRYDVVLLAALLWFMVQFLRFVFPPLFETFQTRFDVSNAETGLLFTVLMVGYASMQFPAGVLSDYFDPVKILTISALGFAVASMITALSLTFTMLTLAVGLIGITTGFYKTVAIPMLSQRYTEDTGFALGILDTIGQFGGTAAPLAVVVFTLYLPWQSVFVVATGVSLLLAWAFFVQVGGSSTGPVSHRSVPEQDRNSARDAGTDRGIIDYLSIFGERTVLYFLVVTLAFSFAWNGVTSFYPLYLVHEVNVSNQMAALLYSVLFVVGVCQIPVGMISDRFGQLTMSGILTVATIAGLSAVLVVHSVPSLLFSTFLLGVGLHGFRPVRDAYLVELLPESVEGGSLGMVRTAMLGVGALAPVVLGLVIDFAGFHIAFTLILGFPVVGLFSLLLLGMDVRN